MAQNNVLLSYKKLVIFAICVGFLLQIGNRIYTNGTLKPRTILDSPTTVQETQGIGVRIEFSGELSETVTVADAGTVFMALQKALEEKQLPLITKQYDFGVFVERIGTYSASPQKAWIYYLNGQSGDIAADKKIVKAGDQVEWKYESPNP